VLELCQQFPIPRTDHTEAVSDTACVASPSRER